MRLRSSIVRKYLLISLLGSVAPMIAVGALYDRYAGALLEQITGERLTAQLTATASRITAFIDVRTYQIETLSNYPALPVFARTGYDPGGEIGSLLRIEADGPDLYGILLFDQGPKPIRIVAGQAASGAPYWSNLSLDLTGKPVTRAGDTEVIGPVPPSEDQSGYILMRQTMRPSSSGASQGSIALHVRLASITELMGGTSLAGIIQPVLKTPVGFFDSVGKPVVPGRKLAAGPEILPGWQPMLVIDPDQLISPFVAARQGLFVTGALVAVVTFVLFARLSGKLRDRITPLVKGAEAVAAGNLDYRIAETGDDEISGLAKTFNAMSGRLRENVERTMKVERLAALGEFATGVAHEIRNPLATIKTSVQALARGEADRERKDILRDVESEIDRLARVMEDVLAFGRPHPPQRSAVPVVELFRRVSVLMNSAAEERQLTLTPINKGAVVLDVDRDQIIQVLMNLVINSIQAGRPGGRVTLRMREDGADFAVIEVEDDGTGIAPDILDKVTDPFFTTKSRGTGLGLAISRQLVELNGGELHIAAKATQGTLVILQLPKWKEER